MGATTLGGGVTIQPLAFIVVDPRGGTPDALGRRAKDSPAHSRHELLPQVGGQTGGAAASDCSTRRRRPRSDVPAPPRVPPVTLALASSRSRIGVWWLLVTPLVVEAAVEGSLEGGIDATVRLGFGPVAAHVAPPPPAAAWRSSSRSRAATCAPGLCDPATAPRRVRSGRISAAPSATSIGTGGAAAVARFASRARRHVRVRRLAGRVEFGCEEPALTGLLFGYLAAIRSVIDPDGALELLPDWTFRNCCDGWLRAGLDIFVLRLALAVCVFLVLRYRLPWASRRPSGRPVALRERWPASFACIFCLVSAVSAY